MKWKARAYTYTHIGALPSPSLTIQQLAYTVYNSIRTERSECVWDIYTRNYSYMLHIDSKAYIPIQTTHTTPALALSFSLCTTHITPV